MPLYTQSAGYHLKNKNKWKISVDKNVEKLELLFTLLVEISNDETTLESSLSVLQKVDHRMTVDSAILLLGIYPREIKTGFEKKTFT